MPNLLNNLLKTSSCVVILTTTCHVNGGSNYHNNLATIDYNGDVNYNGGDVNYSDDEQINPRQTTAQEDLFLSPRSNEPQSKPLMLSLSVNDSIKTTTECYDVTKWKKEDQLKNGFHLFDISKTPAIFTAQEETVEKINLAFDNLKEMNRGNDVFLTPRAYIDNTVFPMPMIGAKQNINIENIFEALEEMVKLLLNSEGVEIFDNDSLICGFDAKDRNLEQVQLNDLRKDNEKISANDSQDAFHVDGFQPLDTPFYKKLVKFCEPERLTKKLNLMRGGLDGLNILETRRQRLKKIIENSEHQETHEIRAYNLWFPMNEEVEEVLKAPLVFMDRLTLAQNQNDKNQSPYNVGDMNCNSQNPGNINCRPQVENSVESFQNIYANAESFNKYYKEGQTRIYTDFQSKFGRGYMFRTLENSDGTMASTIHAGGVVQNVEANEKKRKSFEFRFLVKCKKGGI